jgi:ankyrin repeat protein
VTHPSNKTTLYAYSVTDLISIVSQIGRTSTTSNTTSTSGNTTNAHHNPAPVTSLGPSDQAIFDSILVPLHSKNVSAVDALLKQYPFAVRLNDFSRGSLLHCAVRFGHIEMVKKLVESGAVIDLLDANGARPIDIETENKDRHKIWALLVRLRTENA